ncbi:MAG: aminotransferase class III-fold pyridoxal phosphate-dependent enzyme [Burkholderiales bacterium]
MPQPPEIFDVRALNARHHVHPMADPKMYRDAPPLILTGGSGCYLTDIDGRRYLDSAAGLWNINVGHGRAEVKAAIVEQLDQLVYYPIQGLSNPPAIELSKRLVDMFAWEGMTKVLFSSGGGDACEGALKLARQYWKLVGQPARTKFISLKYAYHGTHFGGLSANGNTRYREAYEPLLPGFIQIDSPFAYRNPWTNDPDALGRLCAQMLEREITFQGPNTVAAFIAEPIQGAGGLIVPPANYWPLVREICDRYEVLLIADEVVTAFGRTGAMSGSRLWGVRPDIMAMAKGINSGYVPLGATMWNNRVATAWERADPLAVLMHGYTYSGHPLACAAANATMRILVEEDLAGNAARQGAYLLEQLSDLPARHGFIGEVRGRGLMVGVQFVRDKATREPYASSDPLLRRVVAIGRELGIFLRFAGESCLALSPPLVIQRNEIDEMVGLIGRTLEILSAELPGS